MSTAIAVALISGGISLAAAVISVMSARGVTRLNNELEERRREQTKAEQAAELRARYRDPLLGATFDLQSRLFNVVARDFLVRYCAEPDEASRAYAVDNTLFVVAEYLGWVEIVRREIRFLDLGAELANRRWVTSLEHVRHTFARDDIDAVLRIFRGDQRAIGEVMAIDTDDSGAQRECRGYASFVAERQRSDFARWFGRLEADIALLAREPTAHAERLVLLQHALVDVLDILDPDCHRFPAERRKRLDVPPS
jgi:hypothetical protein